MLVCEGILSLLNACSIDNLAFPTVWDAYSAWWGRRSFAFFCWTVWNSSLLARNLITFLGSLLSNWLNVLVWHYSGKRHFAVIMNVCVVFIINRAVFNGSSHVLGIFLIFSGNLIYNHLASYNSQLSSYRFVSVLRQLLPND